MAYTTIKKPSSYFNTKLWSGNGSSQALTGVGHQTDMVWIKSRTDTRKHNLYDVVRGVQKRIVPNDSAAEDTVPGVTAFGADGFTVGSETDTNGSARNFVGWSWNANGAGVANTDGTISSTVSTNTTNGFSIVSYTGDGSASATVGHGLGVSPKMIILKRRNALDTWYVMHTSLTSNNNVFLNNTDAQQNVSTYTAGLINTSPTSSVFSFVNGSTVNNVNTSGGTYIAYCFAEKQGFSKFGSYLGNGNADGTFVYTGFKPAWFMVKQTNAAGNSWHIFDNKRDSFNMVEKNLRANLSNAEFDTGVDLDFLSNGVKMRNTDGASNNFGGSTYIYMAFAEEPLVGDNPATAR